MRNLDMLQNYDDIIIYTTTNKMQTFFMEIMESTTSRAMWRASLLIQGANVSARIAQG